MIGPSDGIAAVISTPALDTNLTLTCGQLTSDADNHASAATTANDAPSQDTASRSITPIPPRKKLRSADGRLLNRASPVIVRTANPCQSYTRANNISNHSSRNLYRKFARESSCYRQFARASRRGIVSYVGTSERGQA